MIRAFVRLVTFMCLRDFETMDPHLLVGLVNTELRNNCDDLADLCATHDISEKHLVDRLAKAGYHYLKEQNRFS